MNHEFDINCLIGDILKYYGTTRFSRTYKYQKDPTDIIFDINVDGLKENTSNIIFTDGVVNEFDYAKMVHGPEPNDETVLKLSKKVKVCKASYMIHVKYTKAADTYTAISIYIYMKDLSKLDSIYRDIPNDIYFW